MKHFTIILFLFVTTSTFAQTGIGTTTPHTSAQLEVSSTTKGFLPPRLTTEQRDAIANPADGLIIYNTTTNTLEYKTASGWLSLISNTDAVNSGEMQYWDGSAWVVIPSSTNDGAILTVVGGIPTWVDGIPPATAPSELIISNAVGGDTEATVTFTAPASTGGTAIAGYIVTSSLGGITATGVSSPITIKGLTNGTAYTFTVTATSTASSASIPVTPVSAPDAPTIGTATGGNAQATVIFTAPANNGGAAITTYTVTSSPGDITATGASSPITIQGLTNGTAYTFTVTATNSVGRGAASAASISVTPATVPDAPTIGTATGGDAQATVTFTAPVSNGGAGITEYTVTSSPGDITTTGASSPITIIGLTNGTAYTFTVTATNSVGRGVASAASISVTPLSEVPSVTNPTTGRIWMDRNLGAAQVATSSTDVASYGDLYQWGRGTDGHELINRSSSPPAAVNAATIGTSSSTTPGNSFLSGSTNWYTGTNPDNLWQGVNGINNPCPSGYRLPTVAEWEAELVTWSSSDAAGAFASSLKFPMAGYRNSGNGSLAGVGIFGYYWSSTVISARSRELFFNSTNTRTTVSDQAYGDSVRCLKD